MISFTVYGDAKPAGSKRAFALRRKDGSFVTRGPDGPPVINVTDDNARSKDWKQAVAWAARESYRGPLLEGPLVVSMRFYRARPKGHFGKRGLTKAATAAPGTKPDVLKLARAVEDALSGVVYRDDAQTVSLLVEKLWGEPARVEVRVATLADAPAGMAWFGEAWM